MDLKHHVEDYIRPGKRAHLVGIGGVSMAPLGEVLKGRGVIVTGSDMHDSQSVEHLRSLGIPVTIGHLPQSVEGADCVIRTAAVHDDNPEIAAALAAGIPVFERAQAWGAIMRHYRNALCVSGTHGKTTTTSMCTHIFLAAGKDPSVMIGGTLPILGAGHRVGHGDTIIAESCEYCNSFLSFAPTVAVILNVEEDHLDFFKDLRDIQHSFRSFAQLVPQDRGWVVVNVDNAHAMEAVKDAISAVRARRSEMNVPPSRKAKILIVTQTPDIYAGGRDFIMRLAYASEVEVQAQSPEDLKGMVTVATHNATLYLPLAELVDIRQELERIAKEKTKAEENLARIEKKLQNESFVSKAPEAVVNAEREKADKARALIAKLGESAAAMRG